MPDGNTPLRRPVVDQVFGHNKAPVEEVLATDFSDLMAEVTGATKAAADRAPKTVKSDADMVTCGQIVTELRDISKRVEDARKIEKQPLTEAGRAIDAFFKEMASALIQATRPVQSAADEYTRRQRAERAERERREREEAARKAEAARQRAENAKSDGAAARAAAEAEAQEAIADGVASKTVGPIRAGGVSAGTRTTWTFEVENWNAIDLNALRDFIDHAAIEKAIRAKVRIQKGNTQIPGVRVFENAQANFRK